MARFTGINRWPRLFICVTVWQDTIALLLGTASASITLDGSQFFGTADQAMSKMDQLAGYGGKGGPTFFDNMTKGALVFGAAIAGPMAMGVRGAIALEDAVVGVGASLGNIDGSTLEELSDLFLEVGANSKYSATEVAGVADELAKAGFDEVDLLGGMVEQVVMLSQATGEGLAPATAGITQAFSMWSEAVVGSELAMTDAARAADVLTIAANQSAGGITDVIGGLTNAGPALAGVGLGFDDAAAAIAYFTNFGYSGAEVGTKLSRTLTQLANPTAEAATLLNDLGISAFDLEGNFVGFPALFDQLQTGFAGMGDEARLAALKVIFGAEAFDLMNIATQTGGEGLLEFMGLFDQTGVAAEQSATRMNTVAAKFDALQEGIGSFFTSLVTGLLPGFHLGLDLANAFVDALMRIPDPIKTIIGAFSGLLAIFATISIGASVFGALSTMLGGVGLTAGGAATALGAFVAPILAIGAAVVGLYAIWKTNFLGLGDVLDQAFAPVVSIGRTVTDAFQAGFKGVTSFVDRFASAFRKVEGPAKSAGKALDTVAGPLDGLRKGFSALTGVTNRVVKPIQAFANGFNALRGAAYDVLGPLTGIAGVGQRFADTLSAALTPLDKFGRLAQSTGDAVSTLGRVFDALAFAIGGIGGGDIAPWLQDVADFFTEASDAADTFFQAFDAARNITLADGGSAFDAFIAGIRNALGTIDVGAIAIRVGSWLISAASDLWGAITSWVADVALPAAGNAARTIWGVIVNIGSWAKGTISDLWPYVTMWASEAVGLVTSAASTLWGVVINIGSWAKGIVSDIWPYVTAWVSDAISGVTSAAATLWGVIVNVGSWAKGIVSDIWPYITMWASAAWSAVQQGAYTIWGVILDIGSWTKGEILEPIGGYITSAVDDAFAEYVQAGEVPSVGPVEVKVDSYTVDGNSEALATAAEEAANREAAAQESAGYKFGFLSVRKFMEGMGRGFDWLTSGGGGDGTGGAGGGRDFSSLWASIDTVFTTVSDGFRGAVDGAISALESDNPFSDMANRLLALPGKAFAGMSEGFSNMFGADAPIWTPIKKVGEIIEGLWEDISSIELSPLDWDWASLLPEPDFPDWLTSEPQWAKNIREGRWPWDNGGGSGGDPDIGGNWSGIGESLALAVSRGFSQTWLDFAKNILPNLIPGGGGGGYELPAASPIDFSAVTSGIEDVKARLAEIGPAIQGAFGVSIDTSAFTGGLESAKASLVDLATTAQMQTLAMAMAGLQMGQAFVTGVQAGISAGAGQVAGAITSLMAPASASRAQMALYGINAGLGYGTGVAAGIRSQTGAVAGAAASYLAVVSGYRGAMMAAGIGIGAALGQGIAAGIRSQIGAVAAAAASMVTTAVAAARAAGGIQSPSTVMRDQVGLNLALGTAEGILAGLPAIYRAADRMVYIPDVPNRGFAGGGGTIVQTTNNAPTTVNVTVEGSVTGENELLGRFAQEIAERVHRRDVAIGVAQ